MPSSVTPNDATGIGDDPPADSSKRTRPDTIPDNPDRPAKARKVAHGDDHKGASKRLCSDIANGHSDVTTWKPNLSALGPIVITPAWTSLAPPASPFFSTGGNINQDAAAVERWVYGHQHNKLQIAALAPAEVWTKIIQRCDNMTVWMLRNSCRDMMKLCEASVPSLRGRRGRACPDRPIKRGNHPWSGLEKHRDEMKALLNKQQFCEPCQDHRRRWPSETELGAYPDPELDLLDRLDIGRSAKAPVCSHVSLTWARLRDWWDEMPAKPHRVVCRNKTHDKYCESAGRPSSTIHSHSDVAGEARTTVADVKWEAAIVTLPCDDNGIPLRQLSYTGLRDLIWAEASKADSGLPQLLCPHMSWQDESLLRPFDPTVCGCMDTAHMPMDEAQERHDPAYCVFHHKEANCCLCQMAKCDKAGIFVPEDQVGGQYVGHGASCADCATWYSWTRRLDGESKRWKLWLKMKYRVDTNEADSKSWLHRIAPGSIAYNFRTSERLKHRSWCDDGGCATSYRGRKNAKLLGIE